MATVAKKELLRVLFNLSMNYKICYAKIKLILTDELFNLIKIYYYHK
jgi:hypothetical protein